MMCAVCCLLSDVCCLMFVVYCLLCVVWCVLLVVVDCGVRLLRGMLFGVW